MAKAINLLRPLLLVKTYFAASLPLMVAVPSLIVHIWQSPLFQFLVSKSSLIGSLRVHYMHSEYRKRTMKRVHVEAETFHAF